MTMAWTVEAHYFDLGAPGPVPSARRWPHALGLWLAVGAAHAGVLTAILNMPARVTHSGREIIQAELIQPPAPLPVRPALRPEPPKPVPKRPPQTRPEPPRETPAIEPASEIRPAAPTPAPILAAPAPAGEPPAFTVPVSSQPDVALVPAPSAQITEAEPLPLVLPVYSAAYLENPPPVYPPMSRQRRESGRVLLRVYVSAAGRGERVEVKASSGFERLDQAAREAVAAWRFVPARRGADPVAAWVQIPIVFVL